ncbi:MAG: sulfur carrier protein ThiS [Verrucomicrobia bacterium]|nr:sulfur carrier protein ThiS [Verrucomicrobiota bacterium]
MKILINGHPSVQSDDLTVGELLARLNLPEKAVLVERNREPVARKDFDGVRLREGDVVEIVQMVAGG